MKTGWLCFSLEQVIPRIKSQEKIDYFERCKRMKEIPLFEKYLSEKMVKDKEFWEAQEATQIENSIAEREDALIQEERLKRIHSDRDVLDFKAELACVYGQMLKQFEIALVEEGKKRLAKRIELRREQRRQQWLPEKEEERLRKEEEEERALAKARRKEREAEKEKHRIQFEKQREEKEHLAQEDGEREKPIDKFAWRLRCGDLERDTGRPERVERGGDSSNWRRGGGNADRKEANLSENIVKDKEFLEATRTENATDERRDGVIQQELLKRMHSDRDVFLEVLNTERASVYGEILKKFENALGEDLRRVQHRQQWLREKEEERLRKAEEICRAKEEKLAEARQKEYEAEEEKRRIQFEKQRAKEEKAERRIQEEKKRLDREDHERAQHNWRRGGGGNAKRGGGAVWGKDLGNWRSTREEKDKPNRDAQQDKEKTKAVMTMTE